MIDTILKMSRPRFWLYLAGPYVVGLSTIYTQPSFTFQWRYLIILIFFLFPMNFLLYSVNDYFDQDTDATNPKKIVKENRFDTKDKKITLSIQLFSFFYAVAVFFLLSTNREKGIFILFMLLSFFYSAPPVAFKRRPFLDSLSNVLYFLPGLLAVYHVPSSIVDVSVIFALTCWTFAMHLFSAVPDIEYDKKAGIKTTAVLLGKNRSLFLCSTLWIIFASICISNNGIFFPALIYPLVPLFVLVDETVSIHKVYWYFPYLNGILGFLFFLFNVLYI